MTEPTVWDLFADVVRRFPERQAVTFQGASLSYRELARRVDAFARDLVCRGVSPGDAVAIQLAPSLDTMIALLGTLRAGACYVPIDADAPADRVRYLVDDSGAKVLVDHLRHLGHLGHIPDDDPPAALPRASATDAAYLIYTSGTTGMPKGVVIEHRSLVNYVTWFRDRYGIDESHAAVVLTSYAFDLAYTTLWTTILAGGELHFLPRAACDDVGAVARYIGAHRISFIKVTPSLLSALVRSHAFDRAHCGSLRLIVTGGERVRVADVETVYARLPDVRVVNHYGPTETTIGVTTHPIERARLGELAGRSIIGRPIGNVTAYVVTDAGALAAAGETGELWIGGRAVGRGYHRRAQLTAEKFVPDPFAPAGIVYRTGDLARWTPEGTLELLGRSDRQLKVRGYRIEPSEIELVIQRLGVPEVVVVEKLQALCAYYIGDSGPSPAELRARLVQVLPAYMVPTHLIRLAGLPRTANGKLDVAALPEPQAAAAADRDAPRTEIEHVLAQLWSDVLGIDRDALGVSQSFFELGGHSLLMIQLIAEIDNHFGRTVEMTAFYGEGSIRALARMLEP
jgi:amino acid adenylation domain-containing protein